MNFDSMLLGCYAFFVVLMDGEDGGETMKSWCVEISVIVGVTVIVGVRFGQLYLSPSYDMYLACKSCHANAYTFIRNLSTHMALKVSEILPIFWPKKFLSSFLFLVKIRSFGLKLAKLS